MQKTVQKRAIQIYQKLLREFGEPACPLHYRTPEQLAVAVILSAQCTDERVNQVTPQLFSRFPDMAALSRANVREVEQLIYSTGFYRNKAKNIVALAKTLVAQYGGKIPRDFTALCKLPGIGRKTANVIMAEAFGESPGITVDTHVMRLSRRLGLSDGKNALAVERDLMRLYPRRFWLHLPLLLIFHGRKTCKAIRPRCAACCLARLCPSAEHAENTHKKKIKIAS
ncbi:MAG: endonuclease III [Leptospiraceae bacterium]|nr:endonuclease III [Leptospiraceae bacterium]